MHETIAILDFGSQYTQLIARRIREQKVFCRVYPFDVDLGEIRGADLKGVILSGGPASVYDAHAPALDPAVFDLGVPVLGICYGLQALGQHYGGEVAQGASGGEYGRAEIEIATGSTLATRLFRDVRPNRSVWMASGSDCPSMSDTGPPSW